jgi:hypothetical protein
VIARSTTTFAELEQLLLDLGFTQSRRGKFWFFEHPHSKLVLAFRPYRSRERVTLVDLHVTRQDLDWHELMRPEAFDQWMNKATA